MCHFELVTVANFMSIIEDKLKALKLDSPHVDDGQNGCEYICITLVLTAFYLSDLEKRELRCIG